MLAQLRERHARAIDSSGMCLWDWDLVRDSVELDGNWGPMLGYTTGPKNSSWYAGFEELMFSSTTGELRAVAGLRLEPSSRARVERAPHLILDPLGGGLAAQRTQHGPLVVGVAGHDDGHLLGELGGELVVQAVDDDEALRRIAGLPVVVEAAIECGIDHRIQIIGGEQDERVGAAEFEHDLLQVPARLLRDRHTCPLGTGEGDPADPRVGDRLRDLVVVGEHVRVAAERDAGVAEDLLDRTRRIGALPCVLQQDRVADDHVRPGEPRDLVERKFQGMMPSNGPVGDFRR